MSDDQRRQSSEEWQDVPSRKGRRQDQKGTGNSKVITKFFVSNLPPKCLSSDLKEVFRLFGSYEGSYIARKLDRLGKRFGFVSFSGIMDVKMMVGEMSDLWMGSFKLFVSVAHFVDGEKVDVTKDDDVNRRKGKGKAYGFHANPSDGGAQHEKVYIGEGVVGVNGGGGRTFLDSLLNRNKVDVLSVDDNVEGFYQWHNLSVLGRVVDFKRLTELKRCFTSKGWKNVGIKYVSGFTVMLVFKTEEECNNFLMEKDKWSDVFVSLERWNGNQMVADERIAWLKVHGVPVQLAIDQVFDMVGSRYGKVIKSVSMYSEDSIFLTCSLECCVILAEG
ncbi:putative RNA recognition motif domain, nucleotide-binding alpha-beta plait domain superfamily [Helianthus annuus]|nr:putative RNA recognition motif domain, nucleotide-binding alpha-beta plait domain superfamily [Helianthus annuus]